MNDSPHSKEVTLADFASNVLERSHQVPVLVDFWAAWCGPCQQLMPILTKLAADYAGRFELAKVNTEAEQSLAAENAVRSLPTVKLFRNGQVIDEFMGALPESAIREFLDRHLPRPSDALVDAALLETDNTVATEKLHEVLQVDPRNDRARVELVTRLIRLHRFDDVADIIKGMSQDTKDSDTIKVIQGEIKFARIVASAPVTTELEAMLATKPDDCAVRYQLSARQWLDGDHESALANLLTIVKQDRGFDDDAGRKGLLSAFEILGNDHPLTQRYRGLLAMALN